MFMTKCAFCWQDKSLLLQQQSSRDIPSLFASQQNEKKSKRKGAIAPEISVIWANNPGMFLTHSILKYLQTLYNGQYNFLSRRETGQ